MRSKLHCVISSTQVVKCLFLNLGTSRLSVSTPLSPIKESRKETESLLDFNASPIRENKLQLAAVPKKQSSRIRLNLKQTIVDEK